MEVKDIIRNRRLELDLTLEQIAQRVGVSKPTVMRWENGDIENMRADKIAKLAKALNCRNSLPPRRSARHVPR